MPYVNGAFNSPAILLLPGSPGYSFGSYNDHIPASQLSVSESEEDSGNSITIFVSLWQGPIPVVGQLLSTQGLVNVPNVNSQAITAVTGFTTGALNTGTISYPDPTHTGLVALAKDAGEVLVPQQEVAVSLVESTSGQQFAIGNFAGLNSNGRVLAWETEYPTAPDSVVIFLEAAINDVDDEYQVLDTSSNPAGELRYVQDVKFNFARITCSAVSGTTPTVIAKILC